MGSPALPPLICLHGTSTTASSFYAQMLALSGRGYRVISASWPPYWTVKEWEDGFRAFLDGLRIDEAHLLGFDLGGLLALQFAVHHSDRVSSLILCSAYADTSAFVATPVYISALYWMPDFAVKTVLLQSLPPSTLYPEAVDFVVQEMATMTAGDVASRLTLLYTQYTVTGLEAIDQSRVTLVFPTEDVHLLPDTARDRLVAALPDAKVAWLKEGGDFPHLSAPDQVTLHLVLHLRRVGCPTRGAEEGKEQAGKAASSKASSSPVAAAPKPGTRAPQLSAPLFKPARRVLEGGGVAVGGYEAQTEEVDEARVAEQLKRHAELKVEEAARRERGQRESEVEDRRRDSL